MYPVLCHLYVIAELLVLHIAAFILLQLFTHLQEMSATKLHLHIFVRALIVLQEPARLLQRLFHFIAHETTASGIMIIAFFSACFACRCISGFYA